jgi:hypothetical protein
MRRVGYLYNGVSAVLPSAAAVNDLIVPRLGCA